MSDVTTKVPYGTVVVSSKSFTGNTSSISNTTLFTANDSGLYRISAYLESGDRTHLGDDGYDDGVLVYLSYTDDNSNVIGLSPHVFIYLSATSATDDLAHHGSGSLIARIKSGTDVVFYTVCQSSGTVAPYDFYLVVEKLT